MIRFIPFLLIIAIFICCMVVPVAAESQDEYYFPVESPYYELDETSVTGSYYSQDMHIGFMTFQDLTPGGTTVTPTASRPGDYIGRPLFTTAGVNSAQQQRIVFASRPFTLPYNSNAINQFILDFDFLSSNMSGFGDMYTVTLRFTDINGKNWDKIISGYTNSVGLASVSFSTEFDPTNPGYVYIPVDAVSWRFIVDVRSTPREDNMTGTSIHDPLSIYQFSSNLFWQWDLDLIRVSFVDYTLGQIKQDTDFISQQTQVMMNKFQGLDLSVSAVDAALERVDVYVVDSNNKLISIQSSVGSITTSIDQLNTNFGRLDDVFQTIDDDNKMILEEIQDIDDGYTSIMDAIDSGRFDRTDADVGSLDDIEGEIFNSLGDSFDNLGLYFSAGLDALTPYTNAFFAYTSMFNHLTTEPYVDSYGNQVFEDGVPIRKHNVFGTLLVISLSLGALVAILNIVVSVSSVSQAHERMKLAEAKRDIRAAQPKVHNHYHYRR